MFIDYAEIKIASGKGGDGAVAFRREKYVPKGGPSGGNGGKGGDVYFIADENLHTLLDFRYKRKYTASDGNNGGTALKDGKNGADIIIKVPCGTIIKNADSGEILADLDKPKKEFLAAKGGKGGKGNSNFATSTNQTPRFAEKGKPGKKFSVILELKLIAEVGLVGFPNAGKSTFISSVSAARPKIADYPFTTLKPNLGIVRYKNYQSFTIADIPGIIEGAHLGKGLGHKFLRHIERTKILFFLIDSLSENYQKDFDTLIKELKNYSKHLNEKKIILGISKSDLLNEKEIEKIKKLKIKGYHDKIFSFSSLTKNGVPEIIDYLWEQLNV
jgi:GTP-binding protein